jgi:pimeloyl-ACP methyl ester carboxylesterase
VTELFVPVPGGRLHVLDDGAGPAILLLHAGIVDALSWDALVPLLVAAGYRAIRYDARWYGRTETDDVEFSNRADALAVLDALGVERACLVGNSRGGHIATDTAVEAPERVAALVLIGASIGGYEPEPTPEEAELFAEMEALDEGDDHEANVDFGIRLWVDGRGQPPDRVPAAIRDAVREMGLAVLSRKPIGRPIPLQPPAAEQLDRLTMPILSIVGELDVSDIAATARHIEATCVDARTVVVLDVAHMVAMEAPERTAELIVDLLRPLGTFA